MPGSRVLGGRYELASLIGRGGMADVYLGQDQVLGRPVAVKVLSPQYTGNGDFVERFRREAKAAAALSHPNVVGVFDTGSDDGTHYIVMEYVKGKTLAQAIKADAPLLPRRAAEIAEATATALAFAHKVGIVHRDVKPGNVMLTTSGEVKVMDFGIARAASSDSLTQTASVMGTASYFSPEQAQGKVADPRSDIYSLGVVLYEMLTGRLPFTGETAVAVAYKHVQEAPRPPSDLAPDVPAGLDAIVMKCLAKNPANRYQTADELRDDLHRFRLGQPVLATPLLAAAPTQVVPAGPTATAVMPAGPTGAEREPATPKRKGWVPWVIVGVVVVALAVALFFIARSLNGTSTQQVTVPDVTGMQLSSAQFQLKQAGFKTAIFERIASDSVPADHVISYSPKGKQPVGATIQLTVSKGVGSVAVPGVICLTQQTGESLLTNAGFSIVVAGTAPNPRCGDTTGVISQQKPGAGKTAAAGSVVQIWLISPAPTTPPPTTPPPTTPPPTTPPPTTPPTTPPPTSPGSPSPPA